MEDLVLKDNCSLCVCECCVLPFSHFMRVRAAHYDEFRDSGKSSPWLSSPLPSKWKNWSVSWYWQASVEPSPISSVHIENHVSFLQRPKGKVVVFNIHSFFGRAGASLPTCQNVCYSFCMKGVFWKAGSHLHYASTSWGDLGSNCLHLIYVTGLL